MFPGVGSAPPAPSSVTLTVLLIDVTPAATASFTVAWTVSTCWAPAASAPRFQVICPVAAEKVPPFEMTSVPVSTSVSGRSSVTTTPVPSWSPTLSTVMVYVNVSPGSRSPALSETLVIS